MSLVLAIEPDASQAAPLTSLVRTKLGAQLQLVDSAHAAIVALSAMRPRLPGDGPQRLPALIGRTSQGPRPPLPA